MIVSSVAAVVLFAKLQLIAYAAGLALAMDLPIAELHAAGMGIARHAAGELRVFILNVAAAGFSIH